MPDPIPPRIVATNTEADVAHVRAIQNVSWAVRELAANLIRVVRGAGRPDDIVDHAVAFTKAMVDYQEAVGSWPSGHDLSVSLSIRQDGEWKRQLDDDELDRLLAEGHVIRGALQIAASRLLCQTTQERAGDTQMGDGVRQLERLNAELQRKNRVATRAASTRAAKPKRATIRKAGK